MNSIPVPDGLTHYSSRRLGEVDEVAWPVLSQHALDLLRSSGEELHPAPGELLWDAVEGDVFELHVRQPARRLSLRIWLSKVREGTIRRRRLTRPAIEPAVYRSLGSASVAAATITFATTSGSSALRTAVASTSR